jgi:pilus assembly protein CpaE
MSAVILVDSSSETATTLRNSIGADTLVLGSMDALRRHLLDQPAVDVVVIAPSIPVEDAYQFAGSLRISHPEVGVVLIRRRVDAVVLADALRSGVREVVSHRDLAALVEAVRRNQELARAMRHTAGTADDSDAPRARVVTVFSAKGGCGKTTLATNLAAALADGGRRQVCLIDLDLSFGDVAIAMQLFPAHTIADAVPLADTMDRAGVSSLLTPHSPGLSTLVAPVEPGSAEGIPASLVAELLVVIRQMFDFVVIDTPPAFTDHVLAAFDQSDYIALIATLDIPALKNLKLTLETMDLLSYPRDRYRVVVNRADSKVGLSLSEVEKSLGAPIAAEIPSSRDVPAAINRGVPIVLDNRHHPVSTAIAQFAERHLAAGLVSTASAIPSELRTDRRGIRRRKAKTS